MPSEWQIHNAKPTDWHSTDVLSNLRLNNNVPKPSLDQLSPNTVLVRIRAAAINARDMMVIAHDPIYPGNHLEDLVPCADGAGEVEAVGESSIWKVGDRVMIYPNAWIDQDDMPTPEAMGGLGADRVQGTVRQYAIYEDKQLIRAPAHLSLEEIAAIPCAGGTAMNALFFGPAPFRPGMTVLTQGTGGVSCFAIQIASAAGATVIATSSSNTKLALAKTFGATHTINYRTHPNWANEVLRLTNGKGVDHVIEVGGAGTVEQSLQATKQGGLVSLIGFLTPSKKTDLIASMLFGGKTMRGVFNFKKSHDEALLQLIESKNIHPVVAKVYEFEDAKEAFQLSMEGSAVGKIVIRV
ncbi:MAG: hypothetical protein M1834_002144 [Cirrosporium novae-zelandiae]|nr:MAG: hypothetical protein M1834_002144 [Cirrosporium novae-zelandiae]